MLNTYMETSYAHEWIIHRVGGPTYAAWSKPQYISAFATRVLQCTYVYVKEERA